MVGWDIRGTKPKTNMDSNVINQLKQELELLKPMEAKAWEEYQDYEHFNEREVLAARKVFEAVISRSTALRERWEKLFARREAIGLLLQTAETMTAPAEAKE